MPALLIVYEDIESKILNKPLYKKNGKGFNDKFRKKAKKHDKK